MRRQIPPWETSQLEEKGHSRIGPPGASSNPDPFSRTPAGHAASLLGGATALSLSPALTASAATFSLFLPDLSFPPKGRHRAVDTPRLPPRGPVQGEAQSRCSGNT